MSNSAVQAEAAVAVSEQERRELEAFVFLEAQLADESRYEEWEALLAEQVRYWVPVVQDNPDPDRDVSIINDNRSRLATRLRQLRTGTRLSQSPRSVMRRMLSNMTFSKTGEGSFTIEANFVIYEYQTQSVNEVNVWPGRVEYGLVTQGGQLRMAQKKVMLIHAAGPIPSLAFIV
ncbi:aromatic-ring-hydroxylating dioxygenase subunit beta [Polaromonas sp.]|uniref:aromatic-ring-hydroxylating dioxygenase subunit beta n=1 Tax=Polaromonas sp. TaxID=1869339 RepID=UPI00352A62F7